MMVTTVKQYDIKHTGEEMDRLDILMAFGELADMCGKAGLASVEVDSAKSDLIVVKITTVDTP